MPSEALARNDQAAAAATLIEDLGPQDETATPLRVEYDEFAAVLDEAVLHNPYIPHWPTVKQTDFLLDLGLEAFYGGAAGGGKSDALLMAALMFVGTPGYRALLCRRTYADLALPGALMERAQEWLRPTDARWSDKHKTWHFPDGASLTFGYLEGERDKFRYQSSEFQFVGIDELTQISEPTYTYLFSRLRRNRVGLASVLPPRMRGAGMPGGVGHDWVKARFVDPRTRLGQLRFYPAGLADNPYVDAVAYREALSHLDPVTRMQLENGDWDVRESGGMFRAEWFPVVEAAPASGVTWTRYWDLAASEPREGTDPDWTAGCLMGRGEDGVIHIADVVHFRKTPGDTERAIHNTATRDGVAVRIDMEQEPGASGKSLIAYYQRQVLHGFAFRGWPSTGDKATRAMPLSSQAEAGNVRLVNGPWIREFLNELVVFPRGTHDDQVDAASGAYQILTKYGRQGVIRL